MKKITLLTILLYSLNTLSAQITVKGTVSDGIDSLIWATIAIKNSDMGTLTDEQGKFLLDVQKGDTLAISYTGYQPQEIVIDTQEFIEIILENESLDEVILTGYDTRTHKITCHCFSTITEEREGLSKTTPTLSLYPNPSSDGIFHLKMSIPHKEVQVYVTNILGQQVMTKTYQNVGAAITLDLASVRAGIYLINMMADGERLLTQKAIRK